MRGILRFGALALLVAANGAWAEPSSKVAWNLDTLARVKTANAERGKELAQACESCHGSAQVGEQSPYPYVRGQLATYIYKQLSDYKDGSRPNDIMAGFAAGLSEQDMADIAVWYASQDRPKSPMVAGIPDEIEDLAERGDGRRILAPCETCHGGSGQGESIDNPALAGQKAVYLEQALKAYKDGSRHNDVYGRMRLIAKQLGDEEIKQLARYYSGMGS